MRIAYFLSQDSRTGAIARAFGTDAVFRIDARLCIENAYAAAHAELLRNLKIHPNWIGFEIARGSTFSAALDAKPEYRAIVRSI